MKVLVLEDDNELAQWLHRLLTAEGHQPFTVRNGAAGIRELVKQSFDAIICDLSMPLLPGDMFYRAVQRSKPHLCSRFIFITGEEVTSRVRGFIERIKGNLLLKPFGSDALLKLLTAITVPPVGEILYENPSGDDYTARAFSGVVRAIDLDHRQFELRKARLQIRCAYPPQIEAGVIRSLNKSVRTFGHIERAEDGRGAMVRVDRIEVAQK